MALDWNGQLADQVAQRLVPALDEIDMRIEAGAKAELYIPANFPFSRHGKVTGTLQRSIHSTPARVQGDSVVGAVGTEPLPYALRIHVLYRYLIIGLQQMQLYALDIIGRHMRRQP